MRWLMLTTLLAMFGVGAATAAANSLVTSICVAKKPHCYSTIKAGVNAAKNGDTIKIAPGTYAGGITIDKSVRLVGAGAAVTVIRGGGPVVTIGRFGGNNQNLTVRLRRVTITGGLNDSQPSTSIVAGGGISIPASSGNAPGATVSIDSSVIQGNRVTASATIPPGGFSCSSMHAHPCAFVDGGGIDNSGVLTLTDSRVTGNVAGASVSGTSIASNASGGGISNHPQGKLTLARSRVIDNRAAVIAPNGAFTDGGGINDYGLLTLRDSTVSGNTSSVDASVPSSYPTNIQQEANAGGIYLNDASSAKVADSTIDGNSVASINTSGDAQADAGGIDGDGTLTLTRSKLDRNHASASVPPTVDSLALADSGGLQVQGAATISDSNISGNTLTANSRATVLVSGAGIENLGGTVNLNRAHVDRNTGTGTGTGGNVGGGGITNLSVAQGVFPKLTLNGSTVRANRATASPGITPVGGGLFTLDALFTGKPIPVVLINTVIADNQPDQCFGC